MFGLTMAGRKESGASASNSLDSPVKLIQIEGLVSKHLRYILLSLSNINRHLERYILSLPVD